jgi:hypothetical protein
MDTLGKTAGGVTAHMDRYFLGRPLSPPEAFIRGIMVNLKGQRFVNEDAYPKMRNRCVWPGGQLDRL